MKVLHPTQENAMKTFLLAAFSSALMLIAGASYAGIEANGVDGQGVEAQGVDGQGVDGQGVDASTHP
jgi:hypothetical protein